MKITNHSATPIGVLEIGVIEPGATVKVSAKKVEALKENAICQTWLRSGVLSIDDGSAENDESATAGAVELAQANGIDIASVEGTGKDGRVVKGDVEKLLEG